MSVTTYPHLQAPGYSPGATWQGGWEDVAGAITRAMGPTLPDNRFPYDDANTARAETSTSNVYDVALHRFVLPPLAADITIDGTLLYTFVFYESNVAADLLPRLHVWVTQGDSTSVRGTLINGWLGSEPSTINATYSTGALAVTSVAALTGDRVVIEFGYRATNSVATSYTGTTQIGAHEFWVDAVGGGGSGAQKNKPWATFSNNLTFKSDVRVTQFSVETAIQQTTEPVVRMSQMITEALLVPTPVARLSQMVVEVMVLPPPSLIPVTPIDVLPQARYQVRLYDTNGNLLAVILEYKHIEIEHSINNLSNHVISLDDDDPDVAKFGLDCFVEIYRTVDGTNWYLEYAGFHRTPQHQVTTEGHKIFTSYGRSYLDLVWRHHVLYQAKTAYTLKSGPAETVIKSFVTQNMTGIATSPPRVFSGVTPNFVVEADAATGSNWAGQRSWGNLLETIQEIASATDVQFDVRRLPPNTFEFYMKPYTDRSATIILAPEFGSMANPSYTYSRTEESNVIAVLGQGQNEKRRTYATQSAAVLDSPWNHIESTYDARNSDRLTDYMADAQTALTERAAKESFTFEAVQTATAAYGAHYFLGDVVTAKFASIVRRKMVAKVKITAAGSVETVNLEFTDPPV